MHVTSYRHLQATPSAPVVLLREAAAVGLRRQTSRAAKDLGLGPAAEALGDSLSKEQLASLHCLLSETLGSQEQDIDACEGMLEVYWMQVRGF